VPAAVPEGDELIIEIARGLAGEAREIVVVGTLAMIAVTRRAALDPLPDRVERYRWIVLCPRGLPFDNSYARLPDRFFARLAPTPVASSPR
jgi:hypothetical protein